ncbi:fibronectin type III domain-containing protein [Candidatus Gracilibacteria bacterium]|nr:fibronectin type III domain-containing protein [Candidatus Gracilibacteria bacterium]
MKKFSTIVALFALLSLSFTAFAAEDVVDDESPTKVENLATTPLNGAIDLTWDAATDNVAVDGYQVHYGKTRVEQKGETYDSTEDVGDVLNFTVSGLENDEIYYFSVIAYDLAGNESSAWSNEESAIPSDELGDAEDNDSPQVSEAEALNKFEVKITFSEEVVMPAEDAQEAFAIEDENFEALVVSAAEFDEDDEMNKTVILTTNEQIEGVNYTLTVGIDIEDKAGNPMISGTSDTAESLGTSAEKSEEVLSGPVVTSVEGVDSTHVIVNFDQGIVLSIDPSEDFAIQNIDGSQLDVLGVELSPNSDGVEDASAMITTGEQKAGVLNLAVTNVIENDEIYNFESVVGVIVDEPDLVAPSDVANFLAQKLFDAGNYIVKLSWIIPSENVGDTVAQNIYKSVDGSVYDQEASLAPEVTTYDVSGLSVGEHWFKVTQEDAAGNESEGVISKVLLSETGPGLIGLAMFSLIGGRVSRRRRNTKINT